MYVEAVLVLRPILEISSSSIALEGRRGQTEVRGVELENVQLAAKLLTGTFGIRRSTRKFSSTMAVATVDGPDT
jgi:hypothetical protein